MNHLELEAADACRQIDNILCDRRPEVVGAVLANCVARWLVGFAVGDEDQTDKLQAKMLAGWLVSVKTFIHEYK